MLVIEQHTQVMCIQLQAIPFERTCIYLRLSVCVGRCDKFVGIIIIFSVVLFGCVHIFRFQKISTAFKEEEKK